MANRLSGDLGFVEKRKNLHKKDIFLLMNSKNVSRLVASANWSSGGSHFMEGYLNKPKETPATFGLERFPEEREFIYQRSLEEEEGFFNFISPIDDISKTRDENVALKVLENVIYLLPSCCRSSGGGSSRSDRRRGKKNLYYLQGPGFIGKKCHQPQ